MNFTVDSCKGKGHRSPLFTFVKKIPIDIFFLFSDPYFTEDATILNLRMHPTDVIYGTTPGNRSLHRKNGANPDDRVRSSKINVATYDNGLDAVEATT